MHRMLDCPCSHLLQAVVLAALADENALDGNDPGREQQGRQRQKTPGELEREPPARGDQHAGDDRNAQDELLRIAPAIGDRQRQPDGEEQYPAVPCGRADDLSAGPQIMNCMGAEDRFGHGSHVGITRRRERRLERTRGCDQSHGSGKIGARQIACDQLARRNDGDRLRSRHADQKFALAWLDTGQRGFEGWHDSSATGQAAILAALDSIFGGREIGSRCQSARVGRGTELPTSAEGNLVGASAHYYRHARSGGLSVAEAEIADPLDTRPGQDPVESGKALCSHFGKARIALHHDHRRRRGTPDDGKAIENPPVDVAKDLRLVEDAKQDHGHHRQEHAGKPFARKHARAVRSSHLVRECKRAERRHVRCDMRCNRRLSGARASWREIRPWCPP